MPHRVYNYNTEKIRLAKYKKWRKNQTSQPTDKLTKANKIVNEIQKTYTKNVKIIQTEYSIDRY